MFLNVNTWKVLKKAVSVLLLPTFLATNIAFAQDLKTSSSTLAPRSIAQIIEEFEPLLRHMYSDVAPENGLPNPTLKDKLRHELTVKYSGNAELPARLMWFDTACTLANGWDEVYAILLAEKMVARVKALGGKVPLDAAERDLIGRVNSWPSSKVSNRRKEHFIAALRAEFAKVGPSFESTRQAMPIKKVDAAKSDLSKGIWVAKREPGKVVATGSMSINLTKVSVGTAITHIDSSASSMNRVSLTVAVHNSGSGMLMKYCAASTVLNATEWLNKNNVLTVGVEFMKDHDTLLDITPASEDMRDASGLAKIRFDTDMAEHFGLSFEGKENELSAKDLKYRYKGQEISVPKERVLRGLSVLSAMSLLHELYHRQGLDEREATHKALEFYNILNKEEKAALMDILRSPYIDSGNVFALFLKAANDSTRAKIDLDASFCLSMDYLKDEVGLLGNIERMLNSGDSKGAETVISKLIENVAGQQPKVKDIAELADAVEKVKRDRDARIMKISRLIGSKNIKDAVKEVSEYRNLADATWRWRDKFVSWLFMQNRIDLPYDRKAALEILVDETKDPDIKRQELFGVVVKYDPAIELANIERVSDETLERGQELFFARMARAAQNQGVLVASAMRVALSDVFRQKARELSDYCANIQDERLKNALDGFLITIGNDGEELPAEGLPTAARITGSLQRLQEEIGKWRERSLRDTEKGIAAQISGMGKALSDARRAGEIRKTREEQVRSINGKAEAMGELVFELLVSLATSGNKSAAFVVMSQRLHPNESHLQVKLNEATEPYLGKYPDLLDLTRTGGHNMYSSADYRWLRRASHWLEAVPLFIKERIVIENGIERTEEVIDYQALEVFFKEWISEHWAYNINDVANSEYIELARDAVINGNAAYRQEAEDIQRKEPGTGMEESIRRVARQHGLQADIASIAALIRESSRSLAKDISVYVEKNKVSRLDAVREVVINGNQADNLFYKAKNTAVAEKSNIGNGAIEAAIADQTSEVRDRIAKVYKELLPRAFTKRRKLPSLHILTTQGPGMTETFAQTWLEEAMALQNVINDHNLSEEVNKKKAQYSQRIQAIGKKIILEHGLWPEVRSLMDAQKKSEDQAVEMVVRAFPLEVGKGVAELAALIEYEERYLGRPFDPSSTEEPRIVNWYITEHRSELEKVALHKIMEKSGEDIEPLIDKYLQKHDGATRDDAIEKIVRADEFYKKDLECLVHREARQRCILESDKRSQAGSSEELGLDFRARTYMRYHTDRMSNGLSATTAMKEVLAEHGLNHLVMDSYYYYEAAGGNKRYHLLYTPSRVDLGKEELHSIRVWDQIVAGLGEAAQMAGKLLYELYHLGFVISYPNPANAESYKVEENAQREAQVAFANAQALVAGATGWGDQSNMARIMSKRGDRVVDAAGEGYGGFCVPKDGLFLNFCLNLSKSYVLECIGIPDNMHKGVKKLVKEIRYKYASGEMTDMELEAWAAERLIALHDNFREYFSVGLDSRLMLHLDKIVKIFERIGEREPEDGAALIENMAARKAVRDMVVRSEQLVRFMTFYKVWMTYESLREAAKTNPDAGIDPASFVTAVMSEYKPDTQDGRFSNGMRKFEIYSQTFMHLLASLDEEQQALVFFMFFGFHQKPEEHLVNIIAMDLFRREQAQMHKDPVSASRSEITLDEAKKWARNKINAMTKKLLEMAGVNPGDTKAIAELEKQNPGVKPPKETRVISLMGLSTSDHFLYIGDTTLNEIADEVQAKLLAAGLSMEQITANIKSDHGANLREWAPVKDWSEAKRKKLIDSMGGNIHALVLRVRGPERELEKAIQGLDVLDTGVPHKAFLKLLDDPAKVRDLMLMYNPASALVIVDGAAGAKKRAMYKFGVMMWFAACDDVGRRGVYRAIGVGARTVDYWRSQMEERRERARRLFELMERKDVVGARKLYARIAAQVSGNEADEAVKDEEELTWLGRVGEKDHCLRMGLSKVAKGLLLENLDFGTWLSLGGMFVLNGRANEEIEYYKKVFAEFREMIPALPADPRRERAFKPEEEARLIAGLLRPRYIPEAEQLTQKKYYEASTKASGEVIERVVSARQAMATKEEMAKLMGERESGFMAASRKSGGMSFVDAFEAAKKELDDGTREISYEKFGSFLGFTKHAMLKLLDEIYPVETEKKRNIKKHINELYTGREVHPDRWADMAPSYERAGDFSIMADDAPAKAEYIAMANELFYITNIVSKTLMQTHMQSEDVNQKLIWKELAGFFATTIHDHFYPYTPWAYMQSKSFEQYQGHKDSMYKLAWERHSWLYNYIRNLITTKTELKDKDRSGQDALLSNYTGGNNVDAIGSQGDSAEEKKWRAYNALREVAFNYNDGVPARDVFTEFDSEIIDASHRTNMLMMFPVGRTHEQRIIIEGPTLARELQQEGHVPCNIIISRNGRFAKTEGANREVMLVDDGYIYLSADEYVDALIKHKGLDRETAIRTANQKIDEYLDQFILQNRLSEEVAKVLLARRNEIKGIKVAVRFTKPVIASIAAPFHENPNFVEGKMEEKGLPYTCQSLPHVWTTYDKAIYTEIYGPADTGVYMPPRIEVRVEDFAGMDANAAKAKIEQMLETFTREHKYIMVKDAAESGGRQIRKFERLKSGDIVDRTAKDDNANAVNFVWWVINSFKHNVAIEESIHCSPELYMNTEYMDILKRRQIVEQGIDITSNRFPGTSLYSSVRIVMSTANPPENGYDLSNVKWHASHPIILASTQLVTNVGRGGTLEELIPQYLAPDQSEKFLQRLKEAGERAMNATARFMERNAKEYEKKTGRKVTADALGVSYGFPAYLMLDFIPQPILKVNGREIKGEISQLIPVYDSEHRRIGSRVMVETAAGERVEAEIADWRMMLIEPNVGIGLWDRFWLRELNREIRTAKDEHRPINWDNVGKSARVVLKDWALRGENYMEKVFGSGYFKRGTGPRSVLHEEKAVPERAEAIPSLSEGEINASALDMTRQVLHIGKDERLSADQVSVYLKYKVLAHILKGDLKIRNGEYASLESLRASYRLLDNAKMEALYNKVMAMLKGYLYGLEEDIKTLPVNMKESVAALLVDNKAYQEDIAGLVLSALKSASYAPEVEISVSPLDTAVLADRIGGKPNHAFIFDARVNIMNELYPLMSDARTYDRMREGYAATHVIGVHTSWIAPDGRITKAVFRDKYTGRLIVAQLSKSIEVRSVQYHSMDSGTHQRISKFLTEEVPHLREVNPYDVSALTDDKAATLKIVKDAGIDVPVSYVISKSAPKQEQAIRDAINRFFDSSSMRFARKYLIVKPNKGTEGEGAMVFLAQRGSKNFNIETYIRQLLVNDDVVIEELAGNLFYSKDAHGPMRRFSLRINVSWNGAEYVASGFSQVAKDESNPITSVGKGGSIMGLDSLFSNLYMRRADGSRVKVEIDDATKRKICDIAIKSVESMNSTIKGAAAPILLAGVDILLAASSGKGAEETFISPIFLEINPRTAGIAHSKPVDPKTLHAFNYWETIHTPLEVEIKYSRYIDEALTAFADGKGKKELNAKLLEDMVLDRQLSDMFITNNAIDLLIKRLEKLPERIRSKARAEISNMLPRLIPEIVRQNIQVSHEKIFELAGTANLKIAATAIIDSLKPFMEGNIRYKPYPITAERAQFIAAHLYRITGDNSNANTLTDMIDRTDTNDLMECLAKKSESLKSADSGNLHIAKTDVKFCAAGSMRCGISSANASDRHGPAKAEGSKVCNFAIKLTPLGTTTDIAPEQTIYAEAHAIDEQKIVLESENDLSMKGPKSIQITRDNIRQLFSTTAKAGEVITKEKAFNNPNDPLRFLKFTLITTGIIGYDKDPDGYCAHPEKMFDDVMKFTGGKGLRFYVRNSGPSRSGFASSSTVMLVMLNVLYRISGQEKMLVNLEDLALLVENRLLLRSGWNDTYGARPGIHDFRTEATDGLPTPIMDRLILDEQKMAENMWLINTGLARPATRGLNVRHHAYLSKKQGSYNAILESLEIHDKIVDAFKKGDYPRLARLFTRYMELRVSIDSGATNRYLNYLFDKLRSEGLIYGGMLTGAMGGGVAMLVPTPKGKETVELSEDRRITLLEQALEEIRKHDFSNDERPFDNPRFGRYKYAIDTDGMKSWTEPAKPQAPKNMTIPDATGIADTIIRNVQASTHGINTHKQLTEAVPAAMKNTVVIIRRNFTDRFLPKGESAEKQVLITQYKEMMQGLRSRFNSIEEVDGPDELADIINVVTDNGMKVVIIDDGTFVKDGQAAIEGLTGNAAGKYCAVSTAGLDLAETPFVNLNGMAMMGVGILNENDMLMQTAYALLTGESDVPPNFFRDEQGRIRWMVRLPKIVRIAIDVWQAEKIRRLFASAA